MRHLVAFFAVSTAVAALAGCSDGGNFTGLSQSVNVVKKPATNTYHLLYSFGSTPHDGTDPIAGLINRQGVLYGTTANGGSRSCANSVAGCGTVFSITTGGTETVLHRFGLGYGDNATHPYAGLVALRGVLYGTTAISGPCNGSYLSCGTVFSIARYGGYAVLHSFTGSPDDGGAPAASLVSLNGVLYGTTFAGGSGSCRNNGAAGCGTVFSITPSGAETVLYSFGGSASSGDGANPEANLVAVNGVFYGTTSFGGTNNQGTVFSITPSGTETVLHSFSGSGDGIEPLAGLVAMNGVLYGTTAYGGSGPCVVTAPLSGCGTVFSITPSGTETVLHSFSGPDGANPGAALFATHNVLYGTTFGGGLGSCSGPGFSGCGTVFSITRSGTESVQHYFGGSGDGANPDAPLTRLHGVFYSTTEFGGADNDGTVFSFMP